MIKIHQIITIVVSLSLLTGCLPNETDNQQVSNQTKSSITTNKSTSVQCNNQAIYHAYQQQNEHNKIQVLGCGQVIKLLKDDNKGRRHQKFLVKLDDYPQITVLIAHNIDLAPYVKNIQEHTPIRFYGEYIYTNKGGVVHWTHKDPASRHQDGWLEYQGERFW